MSDRHDAPADLWNETTPRRRGFGDTIPTEPGGLDPAARCTGACRGGTRPCPNRQACGLPAADEGRGALVWPVAVAVAVLCLLAVARCSGPMPLPV